MIPQTLALLKDNKGAATVITALTVVLLLGGTGTIELPADRKVAQLGDALAQYQQYDDERFQQAEQRATLHELEYTQRAISRILRDIAWLRDAATRRGLSADEQATLHGMELDLQDLKKYEQDLRTRLKGGG